MDKIYTDRRYLLSNKSLVYLLDKYRDTMHTQENEKRKALKQLVCEFCFSFNGCSKCKDK